MATTYTQLSDILERKSAATCLPAAVLDEDDEKPTSYGAWLCHVWSTSTV